MKSGDVGDSDGSDDDDDFEEPELEDAFGSSGERGLLAT